MKNLTIILCVLWWQSNCFAQNNCPPTFICNTYSTIPTGFGIQELNVSNRGCLASNEHNSTWLTVTILVGGTLQFTINPNNNTNNFDFAVWGPNSICPPSTLPIRCSYALNNNNFAGPADNGNTGINSTFNVTHPNGSETNTSEGVFGNGWVQDLNVLAGETYLILVDNFTNNNGFQISFGGSATLDCLALPVEWLFFVGETREKWNLLYWGTTNESNNDYFEIWRSSDSLLWNLVGYQESLSIGVSTSILNYQFIDSFPLVGVNYYRLKQVDINGVFTYSNSIALTIRQNNIIMTPNPAVEQITLRGLPLYRDIIFTDITGRIVYTAKIYDSTQVVNINNLTEGLYFVNIDSFFSCFVKQ